jgi:CDGSH-type Zn-finger protein
MFMAEAIVAARAPIPVDVEEGKTYWWCRCGKSAKQPFCDGAHKGSEFTPMSYTASATQKVWFCACKQTAKSPLCDGSHKRLTAAPDAPQQSA